VAGRHWPGHFVLPWLLKDFPIPFIQERATRRAFYLGNKDPRPRIDNKGAVHFCYRYDRDPPHQAAQGAPGAGEAEGLSVCFSDLDAK
jgi:hypothetical protein